MKATVVPPVEVLEEGELQLFEGAPGAAPGDQFGLELADRGLGQGVVIGVTDAADGSQRARGGKSVGIANGQVLALTTTVTVEGNLAALPELCITAAATLVADLHVLVNDRRQNPAGEWEDAEPTRHRVSCFGTQAENTAESPARPLPGAAGGSGRSAPTAGETRTPGTSAPPHG